MRILYCTLDKGNVCWLNIRSGVQLEKDLYCGHYVLHTIGHNLIEVLLNIVAVIYLAPIHQLFA